jgi:hypothetical protein
MDDETYIITDLDQFVNFARTVVYQSFGRPNSINIEDMPDLSNDEQKRLDHILSYNESLLIAKQFLKKERNKKTNKVRYIMSSETYGDFLNGLNSRLISNILNALTNKGLIETCFDNTKDDWVFYIANQNDKEKELPETD